MKKLLTVLLSVILAFTSLAGLYACNKDEYFTVTFSPGEYPNATLADKYTEAHLVQTVKSADELVPPVFVCEEAYHVGWNDLPDNVTEDTTLVAVWYKKEFVIKFVPGAVDATLASGAEEIKTNSTLNIQTPVYQRKGYTMDPTWGGYDFQSINGNVTITAVWLPNTYKIYLEDPDGSELNFGENALVKTDEKGSYVEAKYDLPIETLPTPQKDGKTFGAWKMKDVSTKVFNESLYKYDHDVNLEALWVEDNEYLIFYNGVDTTDNPISYSVGDSFVLNNPSKAGYEFLGWTFEGQTEPTLVARINPSDIGEKEFTAHWRAKTYTIQLDGLENAELDTKYLNLTYGQVVGEMPVPVREGFEFVCWTTKNGTIINEDTIWQIDDTSVILVAKYVRIYTIKFLMHCQVGKVGSKVDVYSDLKSGTYDHLTLVKSETEENTYLLTGVKENTVLPTLPEAEAITKPADPDGYYAFNSWKHRRPNGKQVVIYKGMLINEEMFQGTYESGEIVLFATFSLAGVTGWY